jgi:glycosyltransferase involved in cell wall biosynthesis
MRLMLTQRPAEEFGRPPHLLFVAWRDLADPAAGGSELMVDRLATGMTERGFQVSLLAGGPAGKHPYRVHSTGGLYSQFARAPWIFRRGAADADVVVEVCNGMPFLTPLWARKPTICLVHHLHTEMWPLTFPKPVALAGSLIERWLMPRVHRRSLMLTVSDSTAGALAGIGVDDARVRTLRNGVEPVNAPPVARSRTPLFVAVGRLSPHKRIDLLLRMWEQVRPVVGGRLVIIGDGPERARLEALAGEGVEFTGRVSEERKHELLGAAWLLLHPALVEGWGLVVTEAAARGTPALGFDVPGVRDSIVDGWTGLLARDPEQFTASWESLTFDDQRRNRLGAAARARALDLTWPAAVEVFAKVVDEALRR